MLQLDWSSIRPSVPGGRTFSGAGPEQWNVRENILNCSSLNARSTSIIKPSPSSNITLSTTHNGTARRNTECPLGKGETQWDYSMSNASLLYGSWISWVRSLRSIIDRQPLNLPHSALFWHCKANCSWFCPWITQNHLKCISVMTCVIKSDSINCNSWRSDCYCVISVWFLMAKCPYHQITMIYSVPFLAIS